MKKPDMPSIAVVVMAMALGVLLFASGAQAQHLVMPPSSLVPAASIHLDLGKDQNGNTTVDLKASKLAQPSSLNPPRNAYVVWIQVGNQNPQREALLTVDQNLNGEVQFVTPAQHFQLFITAEDNAQTNSPIGTAVVRGTIARKP